MDRDTAICVLANMRPGSRPKMVYTSEEKAEAIETAIEALQGFGEYAANVPMLGDSPWSNAACKGYAILAMKNAGLPEDVIRNVSSELSWIFDTHTAQEAEDFYRKGEIV